MRTIVYAVAGYLLCGAIIWGMMHKLNTRAIELKAVKVEVAALSGQLEAIKQRQATAAKVRPVAEKMRNEVRNEANKTDWGATPVPAAVIERLCAKVNCPKRD